MTNYTDELKTITKKRAALERLISFAKQISKMCGGLEAVQEMAKPSQIPKKGKFAFIGQMAERLKPIESEQLQDRLGKLDKAVQKELGAIIKISKTSEEQFIQLYQQSSEKEMASSYDLLVNQLQDFKRKAQTDVAIRCVLHERGAPLTHVKFPLDQETLSSHVNNLKGREGQVRQRIRKEVTDLIADTEKMMEMPQLPDDIRGELGPLKNQLEKIVADIDAGKEIDLIPDCFEVVDMSSGEEVVMDTLPAEPEDNVEPQSPEAVVDQTVEKSEPKPETPPKQPTPKKPAAKPAKATAAKQEQSPPQEKAKPGFFTRLKTWILSPWNVKWKDLD